MASLYEILTIIDPDETDDGVDAIIGGFRQTLSQSGGEVVSVDKWGRRKFAYPIKKKEEGFYVLMHVEGPANLPGDFRAYTRIRESVMRELILKLQGSHEEVVREKLEGAGPEDADLAAEQIAAAEQRAAEKRAAAAMTAAQAAAVTAETGGAATVSTAEEDTPAPADEAADEIAPAIADEPETEAPGEDVDETKED